MANDNLLTPAQELDAISKALATRVKSVLNVKGRTQTFISTERDRRIAATYAWLRKVVEARDPQPDVQEKFTITVLWNGNFGTLRNQVSQFISNEQILDIVTEAIKEGEIDGYVTKDPNVDLKDFVVYRVNNNIFLRPKTPF